MSILSNTLPGILAAAILLTSTSVGAAELTVHPFACSEPGSTVTAQFTPIAGTGRLPLVVNAVGTSEATGGALINVPNLPLGTVSFSLTTPNLSQIKEVVIINFVVSGVDFFILAPPALITPTPNMVKGKLGGGSSSWQTFNLALLNVPTGATLKQVDVLFDTVAPNVPASVYLDQFTVNGQIVTKVAAASICPL